MTANQGQQSTTVAYFSPNDAKAMIVSILADMADEPDNLVSYLEHVKFDFLALRAPKDLPGAWVAHYRIRQGTYDTDRTLMDFVTWPPIAGEIARRISDRGKS